MAKEDQAKNDTPAQVVEAVGAAGASGAGGPSLAKRYEAAMAAAVEQAAADGVTDPAEVRGRMLAARDKVKAEVAAEQQADADKANA